MKRIAITQRVVINRAHGERRDALDQRWALFLAQAGLAGVPIPNCPDLAVDLAKAYAVEGLICTGGNDLAAYGGDAPERDQTEERLLAWARSEGLPILGVCRGMQVIQNAFGIPLERVTGHVTASHRIYIGDAVRDVNSYHGLAARTSVPALEVWAKAADEVVEAVRHAHERILAVMWHPERSTPFTQQDLDMCRTLFGAAR